MGRAEFARPSPLSKGRVLTSHALAGGDITQLANFGINLKTRAATGMKLVISHSALSDILQPNSNKIHRIFFF